MTIQLREVAQARSGDKGNTVNIALFAPDKEWYDVFLREVTAEKVKKHFAGLVEGEVTRYEVPNILALNFVCTEALGGGGASSLRLDSLGKTYSSNLLRMHIARDEEMIK